MAEALCARQIDCMASVATEYGREVMRQQEHLVIREGRMGEPEMEELMRTGTFLAVVDATHPYAVEVTEHIKESAKKTNLPYLRLSRSTAAEREIAEHEWMIHTVADTQECVELLSKLPGNILLTTGSKELHAYAAREEIRKRLFVRVLPGVESIEICHREQIPGKQIIAMQGPFGTELNEALIRQYDEMLHKDWAAATWKTSCPKLKRSAGKRAGRSVSRCRFLLWESGWGTESCSPERQGRRLHRRRRSAERSGCLPRRIL